jgi:outer membrane murein-binding lipoprotein Lpp
MASTSNASTASTASKKSKASAKAEQTPVVNNDVDEIASLKALITELTARVQTLEATVEKLKTGGDATEKPKKEEKEKKPRAPTAYNNFMKEKMHELKESHPALTNIERMKMAAEAWTESKK